MEVKPTLVIMAAGMGSRFGGAKQSTPVDEEGHFLMEYSIYDAKQAGFDKIICIIKPEMEEIFENMIGKRMGGQLTYAYQTLSHLPKGFSVPPGRSKPWGTAHAVLCAKAQITTPFCVINADDYYGRSAFVSIAAFLGSHQQKGAYAMVGYPIENTLTENGSVSRGICTTDKDGFLTSITERTRIEKKEDGAYYTEDGKSYTRIAPGTLVSMNIWGFQTDMLDETEKAFAPWLAENLPLNPLKCEFYLPSIPDRLVQNGKGSVKVLQTNEQWYGVTYAEDLPHLKQALDQKRKEGFYPAKLWRA